MSMEAYSVAIRLRLIDSVSSGLIGMAAHFSAFNTHVGASKEKLAELESQLKRIKLMGIVGGAAVAVGIGGLELLNAPLKAAREYELAFTKFKTLNLGDAVNQQANQFARSADIMGVSATELMKTMSESVGLFGSFDEARKRAPQIAALNAANSAIFNGKIDAIDEGGTRSLMKFIDRRGGTKDDASFTHNLDLAEKLVSGSGGFIQFRDLASFSQQGGTAFRSLSDQGLLNMSLLLQEQGGARAGTAMMSIYQNLVAGRTPVKTMHELEDLGFGAITQHLSGTVGGRSSTSNRFTMNQAYSDQLQSDPVGFFRDTFLPILAAHGITSESGILKATNDLLSNRTASNQASIMTTQLLQIARDAKLANNAMDARQVGAEFAKDPNARWMDLTKKYQNLLVELGEAALPLATKALDGLLGVVKGITNFAREFPNLTRGLVVGFGVLSGIVAVGGVLALTTAAFKALSFSLGLMRESGAITTLGSGLPTVAAGFSTVGAALGTVTTAITVFAAAYALTRLVANVATPDDWNLGGWIYDKTHPNNYNGGTHKGMHRVPSLIDGGGYKWVPDFDFRQDHFSNPLGRGGSPFVAPKSNQPIVVQSPVYLDGRKISENTASYFDRMMSSPLGGSDYDSSLTTPSVLINQAR